MAFPLNEMLPGSPLDPYSWAPGEYDSLQVEVDLAEKAKQLGFFEHIAPDLTTDTSGIEDFSVKPVAKIRQRPSVINICGVVSATPQAIDVPESCKFIKIETSGRVWVSSSNAISVNVLQTLQDAASQYSIAIVGNGVPKIFSKPVGIKTIYLAAYPDNSEVSLSFISGEVDYRDVR